MEEKGWVTAEWRPTEANRRGKYYRLTAAGELQLKTEARDWNRVVAAMALAMDAT
jgi:DNA-binding PadR family transcriptional regulator